MPTDSENIGISSLELNIGDREFYINESVKGFGYISDNSDTNKTFSGNILYPYILKVISFISRLFNQDQYSKLWNFICIFISSTLAIINLHLLRISSINLFKKNDSFLSILVSLKPLILLSIILYVPLHAFD